MVSKPATVPEYLARLEPKRRAVIEEMRVFIAGVLPGWSESLEYGMPGFHSGEKTVGLAAQKQYFAFYVCGPHGFLDPFRPRLGRLDCGKCCIRFKKIADLPLDVLGEILRTYDALPTA